MKKISLKSVLVFSLMITLAAVIALGITYTLLHKGIGLALHYELVYVLTAGMSFLLVSILEFRLWLRIFPTPVGLCAEKNVWHVHAYQLFYLVVFNPILKGWFIPVPLMRVFYLLIGAKMKDNSYTGGIIYDAHLVKVGANCILGENTLLTPHQMEGQNLGYYPIVIGNNVTIGAHAVILAGVRIEDNAIVASGSVVTKGTHIQKGQVWGGVPARLIKPAVLEVFANSKTICNEETSGYE